MIEAAEAGLRLGLSSQSIIRRVQKGELRGRRDRRRGWVVDEGSVEEYLAREALESHSGLLIQTEPRVSSDQTQREGTTSAARAAST